jgi:hypothetical protein
LAGLITGFVLAILYQTPEFRKVPKYDWEMPDYDPSQDKFMQRFDENGNFVNPPIIDVEEEIQSYYSSNVDVNYDIIENEKNESKPES